MAVGIPNSKEWFFCCDTYAQGQGAMIVSMEVDGHQLVGQAFSSLPSVVTWGVDIDRLPRQSSLSPSDAPRGRQGHDTESERDNGVRSRSRESGLGEEEVVEEAMLLGHEEAEYM